MAARRERGPDAALAIVLSDRGKRVMDDIRSAASNLEATELAYLEERTAATDAQVRRTLASIVLTTGLVLVIHFARGVAQLRRRPSGGD